MPLDDKDKRVEELSMIIDSFQAKYSNLIKKNNCRFIDSAARQIADYYEILLDSEIRKFLKPGSKAQVYKVVSGLELSTVYVNPIRTKNTDISTKLNVLLAFTIAGSFVLQYTFEITNVGFVSTLDKDGYDVLQNHLEFLRYISRREMDTPIFSNSVFWQAFELTIKFDTLLDETTRN